MKLKTYLEQNNISVADFAKMIGAANPGTVYRYLNGTRRPNRAMMQRIKAETGGKVTADSFE